MKVPDRVMVMWMFWTLAAVFGAGIALARPVAQVVIIAGCVVTLVIWTLAMCTEEDKD